MYPLFRWHRHALAAAMLLVTASACDSSDPVEPTPDAAVLHPVVVETSGLVGSGLTLQLRGETLSVRTDGRAQFARLYADGTSYHVTVVAQPSSPNQVCQLEGDAGVIVGAPARVRVRCTTRAFAIGGTVTGLAGSLALRLGDQQLEVTSGTFEFPERLADGDLYQVVVATQPSQPLQACEVERGRGQVRGADVTDIAVTCSTTRFSVGGRVTGLVGRGLALRSGDDVLDIESDGAFTLPSTFEDGSEYVVVVLHQPTEPRQTCTLDRERGFVDGGPVTDLAITCTTTPMWIGGTVRGLEGRGLVLRLGDQALPVAAGESSFAFPTRIADGSAYDVTVATQPTGPRQTCAVTGGSGRVAGRDVTDVVVTCTTVGFPLGGTVSGLIGAGFNLRLGGNASNDVAITRNGAFQFATPVADGATYEVTVPLKPQGPSQTCVVTNGSGRMTGPVDNIRVVCAIDRFRVGGTVRGLAGRGLRLRNGGDELAITADGAFLFPTALDDLGTYEVTVVAQPTEPRQTCTVTPRVGRLGGRNASVDVDCVTVDRFSVGGTVTGLAGTGLTLRLDGGVPLPIPAGSTRFTFPTTVPDRRAFAVTVGDSPRGPNQECVVGNGTGTIVGDDVASVTVTCTTRRFTVGGRVRGLTGRGLVLKNRGGDDLAITADGAFTFATSLADLSAYAVTVATAPAHPQQACTVTGGAGQLQGAAVTNVEVVCTTEHSYTVGGTLTGLAGTGLSLRLNGGTPLPIPGGSDRFVFPTPLLDGSAYAVTVNTGATGPSQLCAIQRGEGRLDGAAVTDIHVLCVTRQLTIGGTVSGLAGRGLVLRNNGGDDLAVSANGSFTFATALPDASTYEVTVAAQPTGPRQVCTVTRPGGRLVGNAVTNVEVACATEQFAVGGTVSGLEGTSLALRLNGGATLWLTANGPFTFPNTVADGAAYTVVVAGSPLRPSQTCVIGNGTGTIAAAPVSSVTVTCTTNRFVIAGATDVVGHGLVLRLNDTIDLPVPARGAFQFPTALLDRSAFKVTVVQQPTGPRQSCFVQNGEGQLNGTDYRSVAVLCWTESFPVGGTVTGLVGTGLGLQLSGSSRWIFPTRDGAFEFEDRVSDGAAYAVTVLQSPSGPRQTCVVENGTGTMAGAAVTNVAVRCTTRSFTVGGTVRGLQGRGLVLKNDDGNDLPIAGNGAFTFPTAYPDTTPYAVTVGTQPSGPRQICSVTFGTGQLRGAPVTNVIVTCGAPGFLRITEVGSCWYTDVSCWFEIHNTGTIAEDLSTYAIRSRAIQRSSSTQAIEDRAFSLPARLIEPGATVLIRSRIDANDIDSAQQVFINDGEIIPWWDASGFIDLVSAARSVDFVRWGTNRAAPVTAAAWTGDAAPALPSQGTYGWSIARRLTLDDNNAPADWSSRAFATPAGRNDITTGTDADADGIPDQAEIAGGTFAGIDLFAMGARTGRRDLFVQIDRMQSTDPGLSPRREALDKVTAAFATQNIAIHFDAGDLFSARFSPDDYNLGGGGVVPFAPAIALGETAGFANFYRYKALYFDVRLMTVSHYLLFASSQEADGSDGSSGIAELPGNDFMVTLGGWGLGAATRRDLNLLVNYQAGTIMHELGHNLGLRHGGNTDENYKPNYRSIMNYMYQLNGLSVFGDNDGDRYYVAQWWSSDSDHASRCVRVSGLQRVDDLRHGPAGDPADFILDFSDGSSLLLDERSLDERRGVLNVASSPIDFDCDGVVESQVSFDTNARLLGPSSDNGLGTTVLSDHDDWWNLLFVFARRWEGTSLVASDSDSETGPVVSPLADDRQTFVREDAPTPEMLRFLRGR